MLQTARERVNEERGSALEKGHVCGRSLFSPGAVTTSSKAEESLKLSSIPNRGLSERTGSLDQRELLPDHLLAQGPQLVGVGLRRNQVSYG